MSKKPNKKPTFSRPLLAASMVSLLIGGEVFALLQLREDTFNSPAVARVAQQSTYFAATETLAPIPPAAAPAPPTAYALPVLMYHYVRDYQNPSDPIGTRLSISPGVFAHQLDYLQAQGYHTMTFADLYYGNVPPKPVILTFDDGYRDAYTAAYPELKARGMRGTFYVVSGFVDNASSVSWDDLRDMKAAGMEIGAHTIDHGDLAIQPPAKQREEILGSIEQLRQTLGTPILTFAYPAGRVGDSSLSLLAEAGVPYAVTTQDGVASQADNQLLLPRLRMLPDRPIETLLQ